MLLDAFLFFNESALLKVRLDYLGPVIDKFLIVESDVDFAGKPREMVLTPDFVRRLPYAEKLEIIQWRPNLLLKHLIFNIGRKYKNAKILWQIQYFQKNQILKLLKKQSKDDILLFGDLDEIPDKIYLENKNELLKILKLNKSCSFLQSVYYYSIYNSSCQNWKGTTISRVENAIEITPKYLSKRRSTYPQYGSGWHFSYFGDPKAVRRKISTIASVEEMQQFENMSLEEVQLKMNAGSDLYGRNWLEFKKLDAPDLPRELQELFQKHF